LTRSATILLAFFAFALPAQALDQPLVKQQDEALHKVTIAASWLPEAEQGGFYQAVADGTYARFGLDVTILPGGPQKNNRLLLAAGKVDFYMGDNLIGQFSAVNEHIPIVTVAAMMQKDPLVLMSHPGVGLDRLQDLAKAKAFVGLATLTTVWPWLEKNFGFSRERVATYNFNAAPFIADKHSIQQGYVTSEPFAIAREGGFKPNIFLLADLGYETYATTIETRRDLIDNHADVVQHFVDASILGWSNYLYGDNRAANALIKSQNPDIDDEQLAFSVEQMRIFGIVDSGDARKLGIGAMNPRRIERFYGTMAEAGVVPQDLDISRGFDFHFVNKGFGVVSKLKH
jgi:NitT/TauT family transport system substrate-binding protein